jgi:hypothetical protein
MKDFINWQELAQKVGTIRENGESVSSKDAWRALEIIIGEQNLRNAVDYYIDGFEGSELVRFILWQIHPWSAMEYCYRIYKTDQDIERRRFAVELLRVVADKRALVWIPEFLYDEDSAIQEWGMGIVDYLSLRGLIEFEDVKDLLKFAKKHPNIAVKERAKIARNNLR